MPATTQIIVTENMLKALWYINSYRYLTVKQVAEITGMKEKSASEMMLKMERRKYVGSFGNTGIRGYGKTPKLYYVTPSGYRLMSEEMEPLGWDIEPYKQVKGETRWSPIMFHRLDVIDCLIALERALWSVPGYHLAETWVEYRRRKVGRHWLPETADYVGTPHGSQNKIVPDAAVAIEHEATGRHALFLMEVDRATERLTTLSPSAIDKTFRHKMEQYDRYLMSAELKARYKDLGNYAGPAVLVVTTTDRRVLNMRAALETCDPNLHHRYRFSTLEAARINFLHGQWLSRDSSDTNEYKLIKGN